MANDQENSQESKFAKSPNLQKRRSAKKESKKPKKKNAQRKPRKEKTTPQELSDFQKVWKIFKQNVITFGRRYPVAFLVSTASIALLIALYLSNDSLNMDERPQDLPSYTDQVTMNVSLGERNLGELKIGLYGTRTPLTVSNFIKLATHEKGYGYEGSRIHKVVPGYLLMAGDIVNSDGTSGKSALDENFDFENVKLRHQDEGFVGMMPIQDNKDGQKSSQFYITLAPTGRMDGYCTIFGRIAEGMNLAQELGKAAVDQMGEPTTNITFHNFRHEELLGK